MNLKARFLSPPSPTPSALTLSSFAFVGVELVLMILMLLFGLTGVQGNSNVTAAFLAGSIALLGITSFRGALAITLMDLVYAVFFGCVLISFSTNPAQAEIKEVALLGLTLLAYPAARSVTYGHLPFIQRAFRIGAGCVTAAGTMFTAWALVTQWNDPHGQPILFGLRAAVPLLADGVGFFVLAVAAERCDKKRTATWCALLFLPIAIFAASMVRFAIIATLGALVVAAFMAVDRPQRRHVLAIFLTVVIAVAAGLAVHYKKTLVYAEYAIEETQEQIDPHTMSGLTEIAPGAGLAPSCRLDVNIYNSIAIRKALLRDSIFMIPYAGLFGIGLDGFMAHSCVPVTPPHNTSLQAYIEFGWIGGSMLLLLTALAAFRLFPAARIDRNATFFLCCLAYVFAMSLIHGRASREIGLFAFLGAAAGITSSVKAGIAGGVKQRPRDLREQGQPA